MTTSETVDALADWDRYEVGRELGRGGMGVVHQARDRRLGRIVALKFIQGADPRATLRLLQEARAQARVDHPGICKIFDVGEVQGRAYIAMKLVDGIPLGEAASRASLHEKVQSVRDLALALHAAHTLGVLHRDIKPANVLVEIADDGSFHPVLMDFGLARHESEGAGLTEAGVLMGTPAYMSPEQARGEHGRLDRRSDVYSLGATLYEALGGAPPFAPGPSVKVLLQVVHDEPLPLRARVPSLPADLETVAAKCLAKEPGRRYDSARALAEDLDRTLRGEPILGRRETLASRLWRRARRNPAIGMLLAALLIVSGLVVRARILSGREAAAAAQVSQDIEQIEWLLRTAYLLPAHDVSLEEELVRRRMAAIVTRTGGGALADYALGRGHLALHEDSPALERLDRASDAGLDTADLHFARGLVLGRLYEQRVAEARRRGDGAWLEERTREIEAQTLAPALVALEKSRGVRLESPSLLDGLIAFYRKDHATAIALGEKARAEAPWLYDGVRLQADAYLARARTRTGPESEAATLDLDQAARLYDAALAIGRSDVSLYRGRTAVWLERAAIAMRGGRAATDPLERAEAWCRLASVIAPRSASPRIMLAEVRISYSHQLTHGEDPQPVAEAAIDAAREALALEADNIAAHLALAYARSRLFRYQLSRGVDPKAGLDEMLAHARRAAGLAPLEPRAAYILAKGHMNVASYQLWAGEDPTPSLRSAIAQFQVVTRIAPKENAGYFAIIQALAIWADYLVEHGQSPRSLAPAVEQALGDCVRLAGGGYCHLNAAYFHSVLATYQVDAGLDPDADIDRATELLASSRSRVDMPNRRTLADLSYLRAEAATTAGELDPPRAELESALAACLGLDAHDPYCLRTSVQAALLFARTPADLARARTLAAAAVEADPRFAAGAQLLAEAELRLGRLEAGLVACTRGLAVNARHPRLLAVCGALRVAAGAPGGRELLARAFALNPLLARRFPAYVAQPGP